MFVRVRWTILLALVVAFALSACGTPGASATPPAAAAEGAAKPRVVATTSIVGDLVQNVAGDLVDLAVLVPLGTDPHSFEATPKDVTIISQADLIIANGAHLEEFLAPLLDTAGEDTQVAYLSDGVSLLSGTDEHQGAEGEAVDPHIWTTPANAIIMVSNVEKALSALDPANAATYRANTTAYTSQLEALDAWIEEQVATIPTERRKMVSDHLSFGYFAKRYGFEMVGTVIPGFSTASEPSAQQLAQLETAIRAQGVAALFVGQDTSPDLVERIANDTGIEAVVLYDGSLGSEGSGADTYLGFMRYNTEAIVDALR
ncbi:MAG: metal ABC transporter substrate-binding protein [Anaerolineae bacterium]